MDHMDPWAILHTQEEWALHIPQPISTNLSHPVTMTMTRNADKRVSVGSRGHRDRKKTTRVEFFPKASGGELTN